MNVVAEPKSVRRINASLLTLRWTFWVVSSPQIVLLILIMTSSAKWGNSVSPPSMMSIIFSSNMVCNQFEIMSDQCFHLLYFGYKRPGCGRLMSMMPSRSWGVREAFTMRCQRIQFDPSSFNFVTRTMSIFWILGTWSAYVKAISSSESVKYSPSLLSTIWSLRLVRLGIFEVPVGSAVLFEGFCGLDVLSWRETTFCAPSAELSCDAELSPWFEDMLTGSSVGSNQQRKIRFDKIWCGVDIVIDWGCTIHPDLFPSLSWHNVGMTIHVQ